MKVTIENQGANPVRVILDHDTVNDATLEAGGIETYDASDEGVIELREMGGGEAQAEDEQRAALDRP
jgi:hypothetical protein